MPAANEERRVPEVQAGNNPEPALRASQATTDLLRAGPKAHPWVPLRQLVRPKTEARLVPQVVHKLERRALAAAVRP